jgi:hypothetical protein
VVGVFPGDACNFKMAIEYDADTQWSREGYYQLYPVFLVDLYGSENAFLGDHSVINVKKSLINLFYSLSHFITKRSYSSSNE